MSICSGNRWSSPSSDTIDINIFAEIITVHQTANIVSVRLLSTAGQLCSKKILYVLVLYTVLYWLEEYKQWSGERPDKNIKVGQKVAEVRTTKLRKLLQQCSTNTKNTKKCWSIIKIRRRVKKMLKLKHVEEAIGDFVRIWCHWIQNFFKVMLR